MMQLEKFFLIRNNKKINTLEIHFTFFEVDIFS